MARAFTLTAFIRTILLISGAGTAVSIFAVSEWAISRTLRLLSEKVFISSLEHTRSVLDGLMRPNEAQLNTVWDSIIATQTTPIDVVEAGNLFRPVLANNGLISSINYANSEGESLMLLYEAGGWRQREARPGSWPSRHRITRFEESGEGIQSWVDQVYDPRGTPWFQRAKQVHDRDPSAPPQPSWSAPYSFQTTGELGWSVSQARSFGRSLHVLSFDVKLTDVQNEISRWNQREGFGVAIWDRRTEAWLVGADKGERIPAARLHSETAQPSFPMSIDGEMWHVRLGDDVLGQSRDFILAVFVPERSLIGGLETLRNSLILICVLIMVLLITGVGQFGRRWQRPLNEMLVRFTAMGKGDLAAKPPITSRIREVQNVIKVQENMRHNLISLASIRNDLAVAREIQERTFPAQIPRFPGLDLARYASPAEETGGDTYDLAEVGFAPDQMSFRPPRDHSDAKALFMMLGDATGHGVGPALIATQVRAMIKMGQELGGDMAGVISSLNEQLSADLPDNRFITLWMGVVDPITRTLYHYSAGQGPILYYRAKTKTVDVWQADAPPLAALPGLPVEAIQTHPLAPHDILVILSDGFYEARNSEGEMFGITRVTELIQARADGRADDLMQALLTGLAEFTAGTPADDDRTAIILKIVTD